MGEGFLLQDCQSENLQACMAHFSALTLADKSIQEVRLGDLLKYLWHPLVSPPSILGEVGANTAVTGWLQKEACQPGKSTSEHCPFKMYTLSCKRTQCLGNSLCTICSVGDFSVIKPGQLGQKQSLQGAAGKAQWGILWPIRMRHFHLTEHRQLAGFHGSAAEEAHYFLDRAQCHCTSELASFLPKVGEHSQKPDRGITEWPQNVQPLYSTCKLCMLAQLFVINILNIHFLGPINHPCHFTGVF